MRILIYANTDWFMYNFNLELASTLVNGGHEVVLLSPPGKYGNKLKDYGFHWVSAPMDRGSLNLFRELKFLLWLVGFLRREKIDLIHSFTLKCAVYGAIAASFAGIRSKVNSITGMGYVFTSMDAKACILRPVITLLMRVTLNDSSSRLLVLNRYDYNFFCDHKIVDLERLRLIPGAGIDCEKYKPSVRVNNKFTVLLAARLLWDKGVLEYVEASKIIKDKGIDIDFLLAGSPDPGNPAAIPESVLSEWSMEGVIKILGHVDDMPTLLGTVDAVALPSYREGLPTGLTEAGACGLPLITTDVPGCNEVVTHEVDGLLVPVKNSKALADAILRLYSNQELCEKLGKAARNKAVAMFDKAIVNKMTIEIYKELEN